MKRSILFSMVLLAACTSSVTAESSTSQATTTTSDTVPPLTNASTTPSPITTPPIGPPPDLETLPLYWFGPLPDMPTNHGSVDFMELFSTADGWEDTASRLDVFKLYGEWVAYHAADSELRTAVEWIHRHGLALAVEAGPLDPPADCGGGIEGFAGSDEGRLIARRILEAGGRIDVIALDEPYYYASFYDGPNACHWSAELVAAEVAEYVELMRGFFPDIVVGDTEPLPSPVRAEDYEAWLTTFREVNGFDLAFLHLDIDWGRSAEWLEMAQRMVLFGGEFGVPVGIIFNGTAADPTDEVWLSITGERVKRYEGETGVPPDHVVFQSWNDHPDRVLPESDPYTFTGFIRTYFIEPASLGFRTEGAGANLALGMEASASNWISGSEPERAFDGDNGTLWSAGAFSPQWVQIDLGGIFDVGEISMTPSQSPRGETRHVIEGRGPGTGGVFVGLGVFSGITADGDHLSLAPDAPWVGLETIRVTTTDSPSWIAWREIQVIAAR